MAHEEQKIANKNKLGGMAMQQFSPGMYSRYRNGGQPSTMPPMPGQDPGYTADSPSNLDDQGQMDADNGMIPSANGIIVTKPTRVLLAEHGEPEAVVPLNNNPDNKTSLGALGLESVGNAGNYRRGRR